MDLRTLAAAAAPLAPVGAQPSWSLRRALADPYALKLPSAKAQVQDLFAGLGEVTARAKSAESISGQSAARGADVPARPLLSRAVRDGVGLAPDAVRRLAGRRRAARRPASASETRSLRAEHLEFPGVDDGQAYFEEPAAGAPGGSGGAARARR